MLMLFACLGDLIKKVGQDPFNERTSFVVCAYCNILKDHCLAGYHIASSISL